jgi:hypothetical protein
MLQPVLGDGSEDGSFSPLGTVPVAIFQIIISVILKVIFECYQLKHFLQIVYSVLVIALVAAWPLNRHACEPFYFITYAQILFWIVMMVSLEKITMKA